MANESKTPGEVAFQAMTIAVRWRPADWGKLDPKLREGWEAAAQAVRDRLLAEQEAAWAAPGKTLRMLSEHGGGDGILSAIRAVLRKWHAQSHIDNCEFWFDYTIHYDALSDIATLTCEDISVMPDAVPTQAAAAECAENSDPSSGSRQDEGP